MKMIDVNESVIDELNLGLTRKGRQIKRANKAVKGAMKDEIRQIEVELAVWMKNSGIKKLTADDLQNYFNQKGLGNIAANVIGGTSTKADKKAQRQAAKTKAAIDKKKAAMAAGGLGNLPEPVMASVEEAAGDTPLTRREVRSVIRNVLTQAYKGAAGFSASRFAGADKKVKRTAPAPVFKSVR